MKENFKILLVNPTIHDFAAYDFWIRPLGLYFVGGLLKSVGIKVELLDLMDPLSPFLPAGKKPKREFGRGKFLRQPIEHPEIMPPIKRKFCRYGLPPNATREAVESIDRPNAIFVGSMMTYWYTGTFEAIEVIRNKWKDVPVILGGVYATLCTGHARKLSAADYVAEGPAPKSVADALVFLGIDAALPDLHTILPAHELSPSADSAAFLTSTGCPLRCPYCGVHALATRFSRFPIDRVVNELKFIVEELRVHDLAIYDDAFLFDESRALKILEHISKLKRPVRIHAASGLSCRGITDRIAQAMKDAGFYTIRLGLETADIKEQARLGGKVTNEDFISAVEALRKAGYRTEQIGAYIMAGMPGQPIEEVINAVDLVIQAGIRPHISEYSPVPKSPLFEKAMETSRLDLSEPLFHNPTLLPCADLENYTTGLNKLKLDIKRRTSHLK